MIAELHYYAVFAVFVVIPKGLGMYQNIAAKEVSFNNKDDCSKIHKLYKEHYNLTASAVKHLTSLQAACHLDICPQRNKTAARRICLTIFTFNMSSCGAALRIYDGMSKPAPKPLVTLTCNDELKTTDGKYCSADGCMNVTFGVDNKTESDLFLNYDIQISAWDEETEVMYAFFDTFTGSVVGVSIGAFLFLIFAFLGIYFDRSKHRKEEEEMMRRQTINTIIAPPPVLPELTLLQPADQHDKSGAANEDQADTDEKSPSVPSTKMLSEEDTKTTSLTVSPHSSSDGNKQTVPTSDSNGLQSTNSKNSQKVLYEYEV